MNRSPVNLVRQEHTLQVIWQKPVQSVQQAIFLKEVQPSVHPALVEVILILVAQVVTNVQRELTVQIITCLALFVQQKLIVTSQAPLRVKNVHLELTITLQFSKIEIIVLIA